VKLQSGEEIECKVVIMATGAAARWLDVGERAFIGKGASGCATCDGAFFKDKVVAVVGGGDSAVEEAHFLTRFASKVYMIHRRDSFRAKQKEQERVLQHPKIQILWNTQVTGVFGGAKLEKIFLKGIDGVESELKIDGLFVAIGGVPATGFVKDILKLRDTGQIVVGGNPEYPFMTSQAGIFACGDCVDWRYKQAITSAGDGCKAALDSQKWLEDVA
jgi:thioredoxin reductase (NADPH)